MKLRDTKLWYLMLASVILAMPGQLAQAGQPVEQTPGTGGVPGDVSSQGGQAAGVRPAFTRKPVAATAGNTTKIEFAVDRATDAAVFIDDAAGRTVRHLAAGALGAKNPPPEPLKPGLTQSLEWDGKDDDGNVATGPFKVRVSLGLKASWGGLAFAGPPGKSSGPNMIEGQPTGIAVGLDGRAYVGQPHRGMDFTVSKTLVLLRDGKYERTLMPFPNLPVERLRAAGAFTNSFGKMNPRFGPYRDQEIWLYPNWKVMFQTPAVTPDGRVYMAGTAGSGASALTVIDAEGGIPESNFAGPALNVKWLDAPFLMAASDGKSIYAARCGPPNAAASHAVYRIKVPERGPAEPFFGEPGKAGNDESHLNDPRAVSVDGSGNVYIADSGNNRIVVLKESDGSFAGSMAVQRPIWVGVHRKTLAVYVLSADMKLRKFADWKEGKESAVQVLATVKDDLYGRKEPVLALDATAEQAIVWVGSSNANGWLVRWTDDGVKFVQSGVGLYGPAPLVRAAADPTHRLVLTRTWNQWKVLDDETGKITTVKPADDLFAQQYWPRIDRDGNLYGVLHCANVKRCGPDGKPKPFAATGGDLPAGLTGTTYWERDFWVDRKGDIYVRRTGAAYHGMMSLEVFDQQGKFKRTALWSVSDGMYGPRVDGKGNIVILDVAEPVGQPYPAEFKGVDPNWFDWLYGSVIRFGPQGGAIWKNGDNSSPVDFEGWRARSGIGNLRTTGGSLTGDFWVWNCTSEIGTVSGRPETSINADKFKTVSMRLKNGSTGTKASLTARSGELAGGPMGPSKTISIKPNSDFTEYTFDMSKDGWWRGWFSYIHIMVSDAPKGSFAIDWIKVGEGEGAKVWNFDAEDSASKKLPADMKSEKVRGYILNDGVMQGAQWYRPGFSAISAVRGGSECHCLGTDFDMDDFGRIYAPDSARFRVGVLDANGNEVTSFGDYGNQDNCGPDSYVLDPAGNFLRPRKDDDPKDLVSPFARPEVPLYWINGIAVTDRHAFITDCLNRRILKVKLGYEATESCEIR